MRRGTRNRLKLVIPMILFILTTSTLEAGLFKMEVDKYFVEYLHPGEKVVVEVPLGSVTVGIIYLRQIREPNTHNSKETFTGGLDLQNTGPVKVKILETTFIEKVNGTEGRSFQPIDVSDHETRSGRKPTIYFLEESRKLPIIWTEESDRNVSMKFPPIPDDIKQGEILVKLKIQTLQGEQDFERRFPVYQKTYTGKYRIMD